MLIASPSAKELRGLNYAEALEELKGLSRVACRDRDLKPYY
jgi:hypothetical protein